MGVGKAKGAAQFGAKAVEGSFLGQNGPTGAQKQYKEQRVLYHKEQELRRECGPEMQKSVLQSKRKRLHNIIICLRLPTSPVQTYLSKFLLSGKWGRQ